MKHHGEYVYVEDENGDRVKAENVWYWDYETNPKTFKFSAEEHEIPDVRSRTVGNTRLTLLSQPQGKCKMVIDDLMVGSKYHALLTAIYVDRLPEDKIMKRLHIKNEADLLEAKKKGEYKLKDALLRSASYYVEDVLHEKSKHVVTVSSEFVADLSEWCKAKTGVNPLSDVFGTNLSDEEVCQKTVDFLYDFSAKLYMKRVFSMCYVQLSTQQCPVNGTDSRKEMK